MWLEQFVWQDFTNMLRNVGSTVAIAIQRRDQF
jgi:hypothetical protein